MSSYPDIPNEQWLIPSDREIDPQLKKIIKEEWSQPPTAIQLGKALQLAVYFSLTSDFVIKIWSLMYDGALEREGLTRAEVSVEVKQWFNTLMGDDLI